MSESRSLLTSIGQLPSLRLFAYGFVAEDRSFFETIAKRLHAEFVPPIMGFAGHPKDLNEESSVIVVLNASHVDFDVAEIRELPKASFRGGVLAVFGRSAVEGDSIAEAFEAGADEFVRLPFADAIVTIRIMALLARRVAAQELETAHARLTELFHFVHNDLETPLATLQLLLAALDRMKHSHEKVSSWISRCSRAATSMTETLQLSLPEFKSKSA